MVNPRRFTDNPDVQPLIEELFDEDIVLTRGLREAFTDAGPGATDALVALLRDHKLQMRDSVNGGWIPVYAANLLGERGDLAAIAPMVKVLGEVESDSVLFDEIIYALTKLGPGALEPLLTRHDRARDENVRYGILEALSKLGVHDERIEARLVPLLDIEPLIAAVLLRNYGDPAVIPHLHRTIGPLEVGEGRSLANDTIDHLLYTITKLGGELTPEETQKLKRVRREFKREDEEFFGMFALSPTEHRKHPTEKRGRNEPCWCGSGKKYKRCHWHEDHRPS